MTFYESLKAIFLHIDNHEKAFLSQYNLSIPRFYALLHIQNHPGITHMDLSDLMLCTKSTPRASFRECKKMGWYCVRRTGRPPKHLYVNRIRLHAFERVYPEYLALVDHLMSSLSEEEAEPLHRRKQSHRKHPGPQKYSEPESRAAPGKRGPFQRSSIEVRMSVKQWQIQPNHSSVSKEKLMKKSIMLVAIFLIARDGAGACASSRSPGRY